MRRLNVFLQEFYKEHGNKGFFMKFYVRRYYDNIDHDILKEIYKKAFGYDRKLYAFNFILSKKYRLIDEPY